MFTLVPLFLYEVLVVIGGIQNQLKDWNSAPYGLGKLWSYPSLVGVAVAVFILASLLVFTRRNKLSFRISQAVLILIFLYLFFQYHSLY